MKQLVFFLVAFICLAGYAAGEEKSNSILTLDASIRISLAINSDIQIARQILGGAEERKGKDLSGLLPVLSTGYSYTLLNDTKSIYNVTLTPKETYAFTTTLRQPLFAGFKLLKQYQIAGLQVDISRFELERIRQDVIFKTKELYFSVLQAERLFRVAEDSVTKLADHEKVAKNFYDVGITPKNDLLEAEVELANARQEQVAAENRLNEARAEFNTLLRRNIDTPVVLEDVLTHSSFNSTFQFCWEAAQKNRAELKVTALQISIANKEVELAKGGYLPSLDLIGNYEKTGDNLALQEGTSIEDPNSWNVTIAATWPLFEGGKTQHDVREKISILIQAREEAKKAEDDILLQVKKAHLRVKEAEKNILTVQKAIEQAQENLRMNEERYKEQVSTSTDVLDARTLYSKTCVNYYNALCAYNIEKARLYHAMGVER
ncbi:MAG: TolC family protein [Pseudomonadota bacterium]